MDEFEGYIEMVAGSDVKHVFDEKENKLKVHRKTALPLPHPFNYGFIKGTRSGDGDPLDVFVISSSEIPLGETVRIRPIGMLYVEDEMGIDNKVIAVNVADSESAGLKDIAELDKLHMERISYLLEHNKDGMEGRWTKVKSAAGREAALKEILDSMESGK